jgi:hypothetical protein
MYTIIIFKFKFISKEKYLNFVIEEHFNEHSLEKINSNTLSVNGKNIFWYTIINKIHLSYFKPAFDR